MSLHTFTKSEFKHSLKQFKKQLPIHVFVWVGIIFLFVFSIVPMIGLQIAFKNYDIVSGFKGIFTSEFVGLKYFKEFLGDHKFPTLMKNTFAISLLKLVFSFPIPIIFAILIAESPHKKYKRFVQTSSYLPHFISWVILSGMLYAFFSTNVGLINEVLLKLNIIEKPIPILTDPKYYYNLAVWSEIWKETGWNAIIYLAAISGIDPTLYESAQIDGAGRLKRIWHITLPSIQGAIAVILILSIGNILGAANFDQAMMLGNKLNISRSEILEVYVYKTGLADARYSYATAASLFQSVISFGLVLSANKFSKKFTGSSLF